MLCRRRAGLSLWFVYRNAFWEVTACQWQKKLDPTSDNYGAGLENYNYAARVGVSDVAAAVAAFATTGKIKKPIVAGEGTRPPRANYCPVPKVSHDCTRTR